MRVIRAANNRPGMSRSPVLVEWALSVTAAVWQINGSGRGSTAARAKPHRMAGLGPTAIIQAAAGT